MPRLARKYIETPFLHVMVQGVNKEYIFEKSYEKESYIKFIKEYNQEYQLDFLAYCIMSNHAHFAIYTEEIEKLAKLMHEINSKYARMYNKEKNRCGVLFRNRYRIQPIYSERQLLNCINYIHHNPVKAKMVEKCEDYRYSSFNDYRTKTGLSQNQVLKDIFGENFNFLEMVKKECGTLFIDVEEKTVDEISQHIIIGTEEFINCNKINLQDIFSNRENMKNLVKYLKEECGISYKQIRDFFEMTKGVMERIRV